MSALCHFARRSHSNSFPRTTIYSVSLGFRRDNEGINTAGPWVYSDLGVPLSPRKILGDQHGK